MGRNPALYGTDELVIDLLSHAKKFAVVGLGTDSEKPVYRVSQFLQSKGIRVIPIHPRGEEVLGERTYTSLTDAVDEDMAAKAVAEGIKVVMDRCPAIEWPRLHIN